jgi:ribosome-associated heat shock protein Hsp15
MNKSPEDADSSAGRIDRWLFCVRLFKSRSMAAQAVGGGRVHINGARVKPSHAVRPGDLVRFSRGAVDFECTVVELPARRGPASTALQCYQETPASRVRHEEFSARMKVAAALSPRPVERPDKHERRELRRLRGRG